jgi:hypothetical protein
MNASILIRPDVLGVIIGVIGIVLAFVFYARSKQVSRPAYAVVQRVLISPSERHLPSVVEIRYDGRQVPSLYRSLIYFWNGGTKTLSQTDVASSDPIVFHFNGPDTRVLEVRSLKATRDVLSVSAHQSANDIVMSFDFLDRGDGASLEIFYTGEDTDVSCSGTIKGVPKGIQERASTILADEMPSSGWRPVASTRRMLVTALTGLIFGVVIVALSIHHSKNRWTLDYAFFFLGAISASFGAWHFIKGVRYYLNERIPSGLHPPPEQPTVDA